MIQERLKATPLPIVIPVSSNDEFNEVIDVVEERLLAWANGGS